MHILLTQIIIEQSSTVLNKDIRPFHIEIQSVFAKIPKRVYFANGLLYTLVSLDTCTVIYTS